MYGARKIWGLLVCMLVGFAPQSRTHAATDAKAGGAVYTIRIQGEIGRGTSAYVRRAVEEATAAGAAGLIVRLDTPGGRVDAALEIRDVLLGADVRTVAFVDRHAYSAGALIAIACESIWMTPGATMGAATPVKGGSGKKASEKMVSAVRSAFAATAEQRGRKPVIAEAMVDASIAVEDVVEQGKLLSLTTERALTLGYADGKASKLQAVLQEVGFGKNAEVVQVGVSPAEWLAGVVTQPALASLLMSLAFLGLLFEIKTPGWGVGGTVALVFLGLFFWGHMIAGLAGWEGLALVVGGLVLLGLEIVVVPGFGVLGALGLLCLLGGLFISMVDFDDPTGDTFLRAGGALSAAILLLIVVGYAVVRWFPGARSLRGIVLQSSGTPETRSTDTETPGSSPASGGSRPPRVGDRGIARSDLRPAGIAEIAGQRVDVVTRGEYTEGGTPLEVVETTANRTVVEKE